MVNDAHTPERQVNSMSHELSHFLLGHDPHVAFGDVGDRTMMREIEDEADWLAGCLLAPASGIPAAMEACGGRLDGASEHYGVSVQLMRWRVNMTRRRRRLRTTG
ncbi:MAG: hypothetical protein V7607_2495 [Solirubrobacteraceae bacterium]